MLLKHDEEPFILDLLRIVHNDPRLPQKYRHNSLIFQRMLMSMVKQLCIVSTKMSSLLKSPPIRKLIKEMLENALECGKLYFIDSLVPLARISFQNNKH